MRIYVDLDETLITSTLDENGFVTGMFVRPWAREFLRKLAKRGSVHLLSMGSKPHVDRAIKLLYPESEIFESVTTREDLKEIEGVVETLLDPSLERDQAQLIWNMIKPILSKGIMFDDQGYDSFVYAVKSAALGIDESSWIRVKAYERPDPEDDGLRKAYGDLLRLLPAKLSGRALAWA